MATTKLANLMKSANLPNLPSLPPLVWATGKVHQILVQPGEKFFVFSLRESSGTTVFLRIADAHTGAPLPNVTTDSPVYDLMKEAYFRQLSVEVGYRDFGLDPQSGIHNLSIDRVSLYS